MRSFTMETDRETRMMERRERRLTTDK